LGACGTDVKVLATLLVKHGYLAESAIETNADGYTICNAAMVTAIKKFQKDAGLKVDGYAGAATIKALKNWEKDE
jgi:murein L,D-transpeptidase YcbB/YkuD